MKRKKKTVHNRKTLVVDGESLLKTGFHGVKNTGLEGVNNGAIYHFLRTIRKFLNVYNVTKVVVMWDGPKAGIFRERMYHLYKKNRNKRVLSEDQSDRLNYQRIRIKQYLEELFIRQLCEDYCEADDLIAYYCHHSPNEYKVIYTADNDLLQLIDDNVEVYLSNRQEYIKKDNFYEKFGYTHKNFLLIKMIEGDDSDNIAGIKGMGVKTLLKYFPDLIKNEHDTNWLMEKANEVFNNKKVNAVNNLIMGKTKLGEFGNEYFNLVYNLISLNNPLLTDGARESVMTHIDTPLNPQGRSEEIVMDMMVEDNIWDMLPNVQNGWYEFINPYLRLARIEKEFYNKKSENYE